MKVKYLTAELHESHDIREEQIKTDTEKKN